MDREPNVPDRLPAQSSSEGIPVTTIVKMALSALVIAAVVVFVLQNLDNVPVDFLSFSFDVPLILLLVIAGVAGVLIRWLIGFLRSHRKR